VAPYNKFITRANGIGLGASGVGLSLLRYREELKVRRGDWQEKATVGARQAEH
jgi:hypothetical protein